jgi:hypothetical protein
MTVRGEKRTGARAHAEAWAGVLAKDGPARRRFQDLIRRNSPQRGRGGGVGPGRGPRLGPGPGRGRGRGRGPRSGPRAGKP